MRDWVFDLDNTLYPPACNLFAEMDERMTDYVARLLEIVPEEAYAVQKAYYAEHGTTLAGLLANHTVDADDFLFHVHEIDLSSVRPCAVLREGLAALPGRRLVYTNGSRRHARRVLDALEVPDLFSGIFAIEDAGLRPKPDPAPYKVFSERFFVTDDAAAFFEDSLRNLLPAAGRGWETVLVTCEEDMSHEPEAVRPFSARADRDLPPHVGYQTPDLPGFLAGLSGLARPG